MTRLRIYIFCSIACVLLSACDMLVRKHQAGVVAELEGNYLYEADVASLCVGLSSEDSARVVNAFIRQWATDILVYSEARDRADKKLEALVEDYRRSLYVHAFDEKLIAQRMPKRIADEAVEAFYEQHKDMFVLRESIVRGILLVVPKDAPKVEKLKKMLLAVSNDATDENLEEVEKYAYQYATGYELFLDEWKTASQLQISMPFVENNLQQQLRQHTEIEVSDSISTFILQVTDKHLAGELMPMEYAQPEIEKVILRDREVDFIRHEHNALYEKALHSGKLKLNIESNIK